MIDVLMMLYNIVSAGAFNSWLKNLNAFKGSDGGIKLRELKDITNGFINQGLNTLKDSKQYLREFICEYCLLTSSFLLLGMSA